MVNVCGRRRDPRPAIGTIIFMLFIFFKRKVHEGFLQSCKVLFYFLDTN
jgi:hypothetical protein